MRWAKDVASGLRAMADFSEQIMNRYIFGHIPAFSRLNFSGLHGVISQKIGLFITTAVRISNSIQIMNRRSPQKR
jgi:hypothetical protein